MTRRKKKRRNSRSMSSRKDREPFSDRAAAVGATIDFSELRRKALAEAFPEESAPIPTMRIGKHFVGIQITRDHYSFGKVPIWLAFVTVRDMMNRVIPTSSWSAHRAELLIALLQRVLGEVGDHRYERIFRMQPSLCLQRACSGAEIDSIADRNERKVGHLAGGPVDVLFSFFERRDRPSSLPCKDPIRVPIEEGVNTHADLWVPVDCGLCEPCLNRGAIRDQLEVEGGGVIVTI
jgi:hypothetical protein